MLRAAKWYVLLVTPIVLSSAAWGITDADKCEAAKLKIAGKYQACRLSAEAKSVKKGDPVDYANCDTYLADQWAKAETKGDGMCPSSGDAATMQTRLTTDANDVIACLSGTCPSQCGNGVLDAGEQCDLGTVGSATCDSATGGLLLGGFLGCGAGCVFNTSHCTACAASVGSSCWYLGAPGESCTTACANEVLTVRSPPRRPTSGSGGTDAHCAAGHDALGAPGDLMAQISGFEGGCGVYDASNRYATGPDRCERNGAECVPRLRLPIEVSGVGT